MFCQKCGTQNPDDGRFCRSCGTDLGNHSAELTAGLQQQGEFYLDHKGKMRSKDPDDIWSAALRNTLMGIGFFIISMALFITGVANGRTWWWAMLFPAFSLMATGISQFGRVKRIEKQRAAQPFQQAQFPQSQPNAGLPPTQNDYIQPQHSQSQSPRSIYETGEFDVRPPSVTEGTTRHLQVNKEGETVALPKKDV